VIYSYNKGQRDALFLKFIFVKNSTCFQLHIITHSDLACRQST